MQEFEKHQDELASLTGGDEYEEMVNADERASFKNRYYLICGKTRTLIKRGTLTKRTSTITINSVSGSNREIIDAPDTKIHNSNQTEESSYQVHKNTSHNPRHRDYVQAENTTVKGRANRNLPDLKIPTFSCMYDTWLDFFDSFKSIIHSDNDIPMIRKFHYLKGCVTGDAAKIVAALETTGENYKVAWDPLKGDKKTPTLHNLLTFLERRSKFEETRAATRQNTT